MPEEDAMPNERGVNRNSGVFNIDKSRHDNVADTSEEAAFFARGEELNEAHEAGETLEKTEAERVGDEKEAIAEARAALVNMTETPEETAFFARGEAITAAHEAGETLEQTVPEMRGEDKQEDFEMRHELENLEKELPSLRAEVEEYAKKFEESTSHDATATRSTGAFGALKRLMRRVTGGRTGLPSGFMEKYEGLEKELKEKEARYGEIQKRMESYKK